MSDIASESDATIRRVFARGGRWLSAAALAIYAVVVVIPACRHPHTNGFAAYYTASRILIETPTDLPRAYDDAWFQGRIDAFGFAGVLDVLLVQTPALSLILAPIAWMSPARARVIWILASVLFWIGGLAVLARALGLNRRLLLPLAALTAAYVPLADNFRQGQAYALIFLLLCLVFRFALADESRRHWLAGVPLGVMLVLKGAGLWLWLLLLAARRWRVVGGGIATAAVMVAASAPWIGWSAWEPFLLDLPRLASDPVRYVTAYQTITSLMGHLFTFDTLWNPMPVADLRPLATGLTIAVTALVFITSVRVQRLASPDLGVRALSLAMLAAPAVCMAPLGEGYHYVQVLPAVVVAFWWAVRRGARLQSWCVLAASTLLLLAPVRFLTAGFLRDGWRAVLAYPRVYGALLLWGWLLATLRRSEDVVSDVAGQRRPIVGTQRASRQRSMNAQ